MLRYLLVVACFALGLMAKPMLVTLPAVLLLLDYWPLGRLGASVRCPRAAARDRPHRRKTSAAGDRGAVKRNDALGAAAGLDDDGTLAPIGAACRTLRWRTWPTWASSSGLSGWLPCIRSRRRACRSGLWRPPVESWRGSRRRWSRCADRIRICWSAGSGTSGCWSRSSASCRWETKPWPTDTPTCRRSVCASRWFGAGPSSLAAESSRRWLGCVALGGVLAALMGMAWRQTTYWHDSEALWNQTLANTSRNYIAHMVSVCLQSRADRRSHRPLQQGD